MQDGSTGSNGSPPHSVPNLTPWSPSGPIDVQPEQSAAFIAETCQRMAMVLGHYLTPLYAKQMAQEETEEPDQGLQHMICTLEMTAVGVSMIEASNSRRLKPSLTLLKNDLIDASGSPL